MQEVIHTIDGATATTTGQWIDISGARKISFFFKRSNHSSGSTAFTVNLSPDGTESVTYAKMIENETNDAGDGATGVEIGLTRVNAKTLSSNTTAYLTMSPEDTARYLRVVATETTDGTHDAWVVIDRDER